MREVFQALTCLSGALCLREVIESIVTGRYSAALVFLIVAMLNAHGFITSRSRT
jgi:hypothetical protein